MSKIGKMPVPVLEGVTIQIADNTINVTGPKGSMAFRIPGGITVAQQDGNVVVTAENLEDRNIRALYGLTRARIANMVKGVKDEFQKKLELSGVGYRAQVQGADLVLSVGFSHPVKIKPAPGITFTVNENVITVQGADKDIVGNIAARVRAVRPPEPYKGKGIKYAGERVRRKAGKAAKAVGGAK